MTNPSHSASSDDTPPFSPSIPTVAHTCTTTTVLESDALKTMRRVLGNPTVGWRSVEQRDAMMATLDRRSDIVTILATGGGKSMLAIIPSIMEEATATVLVLPLNSLIMDYQRRLTQMRVSYQLYGEDSQLDVTKNLILVSADKAQTRGWRSALSILNQKKTVARLVFDEAHIPMIAKDYRKSLENIHQVRSLPMQLVLLSATLPPTFIPELISSYNLLPNTTIVRQSTNRPELIYVLEKMKSTSLQARTTQILAEEELNWSSEDRGLVFVASIAEGQKLVNATHHAFYVGDRAKMSDEERRNAYDEWIQGSKKVMVATTAFCTGNDYQHVRLVIHMDKPFDMLEFCQGQGRAGRDGRAAKCYLLTQQSASQPSSKESGALTESKVAMHDHVFTYGLKRCLRYGTTLFADGTGIGCRQLPDNQPCCVCSKNPDHRPKDILIAGMPKTTIPPSKPTHTSSGINASCSMPPTASNAHSFIAATNKTKQMMSSHQLKSSTKVDAMLVALRQLENICTLCKILDGETDEDTHHLYRCPRLISHANSSWDEYKEWRKGLRYVKWHNKICWLCHVPQLSDSLHPTFSKANQGRPDCQFADVVAPTAFAIYHHQALKTAAQQYFQQEWKSLERYACWLMDKPAAGSESNLMDLFMWYSATHAKNIHT